MWFRNRRKQGDLKARGGVVAAPRRSPKFGPRTIETLEDRALMSHGIVTLMSHSNHTSMHQHHTRFRQTNLVSDVSGLAKVHDTNLVNPWGLAASPTGSPWWINENHTGFSTVYDVSGKTPANTLRVTIPVPSNGTVTTSAPTGIVFNNTSDFLINGKPALFIFDTEDGTISAWNSTLGTTPGSPPTSMAKLEVDNLSAPNGAVYKGLALGTAAGANYLYATNFRTGKIDVFDNMFKTHTFFAGQFTDPNLPAGFAPFGIANISNGLLFVTYAKQDAAMHDDVAGPGNGFIDVFNTSGDLLGRFASGSAVAGGLTQLNSPWGIALAPSNFGQFSGDLLVGNFGDGHINAFKIQVTPNGISGQFDGQLSGLHGKPIVIDGLWGLAFGNGGKAGPTNTLFFTAGIANGGMVEDHGLFGTLTIASM